MCLLLQTGCSKSIASDESVFARLDHFQEHELATRISQASARRNAMTTTTKHVPKRRGRPPKQSQNWSTIDFSSSSNSGSRPAPLKPKGQHPWVIVSLPIWPLTFLSTSPGFNFHVLCHSAYTKYDLVDQCQDEVCIFRDEEHYHCNKDRCFSSSNRLDVIDQHSKNFHDLVQIPESESVYTFLRLLKSCCLLEQLFSDSFCVRDIYVNLSNWHREFLLQTTFSMTAMWTVRFPAVLTRVV